MLQDIVPVFNQNLEKVKSELFSKIEINKIIPPIIHYFWFGKEIDSVNKCVASWKKYNSNFLFLKWDDSFFRNNKFVQQLLFEKRYAFATDYMRLWVLYNFGGIYLDTDVECFKSFDDLLNQDYILGYENDDFIIDGATIGCKVQSPIIKKCFDWYENKTVKDLDNSTFLIKGRQINGYTICNVMSEILQNDNLHIYPNEYFVAGHYMKNTLYKQTDKTYTKHHFNGSWLPKKEYILSDFGWTS